MPDKSLFDILGNNFQASFYDPQIRDLLDGLENYRENLRLSAKDVSESDLPTFFRFTDGLRASYYYRWKEKEISAFMNRICITFSYIALYIGIDAELTARFKSLLSDLRKMLEKSIENDPNRVLKSSTKSTSGLSATVRDRVGVRLVTSKNSVDSVYQIFYAIIGILGGLDPQKKEDFTKWFENSDIISPSHKRSIREILDVPFAIEHLKDYIQFPKKNGYRTLQFTMVVQFYSNLLPGLPFEVQIRTEDMDKDATSGTAAHEKYHKNKIVYKVFSIDNPCVALRIKEGLTDFIPICHHLVCKDKVEIIA